MTQHREIEKKALEEVRESNASRVKLAVTDIDGILRGKYVHIDKFKSAVKGGFGFCNVVFGWDCNDVCYDNAEYTGWHTGYPDAQVQIDLGSYRKVPWDGDVPFFLGDFVDGKGGPLSVCPRQLLKAQIAKANAQGYDAKFGLEFEWFNFCESPQTLAEKGHQNPEPITPGMFGYSLLRSSQNRNYFSALMEGLSVYRVPLEGLHTETGPGVYEAALAVSDALEAADRGVLFKSGVKEIAQEFQIIPSFMAKWSTKLPGCSGHIHQSLWSKGKNIFFDGADSVRMSNPFKNYLAGQMKCLPEILPLFAPTVNSYKRLVEGLWAPTRVTWGIENRTSAFRVIPGSEKSTRLETRVAGSDMNPYLAIAGALGSGLYGIEKGLSLESEPVQGNAYERKDAPSLPKNLIEATRRMADSEAANSIFGEDFISHFTKTREWEWRQFQEAVTDWEMQRYFEII